MEKMKDLKDLLKHEIQDLYSAEEQVIDALPTMIERAKNADLKKALQDHLRITREQLSRLEQVQSMMGHAKESSNESKGLLSRLFKSRQVCRGMEGLIEEGNKIMGEDMHPDVLDAAIIASAQKIEHYEICGYGTARSFARELGLEKVAQLLEQTLDEEYSADDLLTQLAIGHINWEAEIASKRGRASAEKREKARSVPKETVRSEEREMELVSNRGRTAAAAKRDATAGRPGGAPKSGEVSRGSSSAGRSAGSKRNAAAGSRSETKSTRNGSRRSSSGRGSGSSRGSSRTR